MLVIVQSPYWFTIGCRGVFSLGGWTPHIQTGFPEPDFTRWANQTSTTGLSPSAVRHSNASLVVWLIRVRSPLLTESLLLSFPVDTEMFQFSTFALHPYAFRVKYPEGWVAPFRNPGVAVCLPTRPGLSQVTTSFIASRHQDIHHVPLCSVTNQASDSLRFRSVFPSRQVYLRFPQGRVTGLVALAPRFRSVLLQPAAALALQDHVSPRSTRPSRPRAGSSGQTRLFLQHSCSF